MIEFGDLQKIGPQLADARNTTEHRYIYAAGPKMNEDLQAETAALA
ncbi:MAG: hypothetical protein RBT36_04250 [Desulfobulbus sp.]|nr:hypothetical protein [Desulfobulbus sp.]